MIKEFCISLCLISFNAFSQIDLDYKFSFSGEPNKVEEFEFKGLTMNKEVQVIEDQYYDTKDFKVYSNNHSLRLRRKKLGAEIHLKYSLGKNHFERQFTILNYNIEKAPFDQLSRKQFVQLSILLKRLQLDLNDIKSVGRVKMNRVRYLLFNNESHLYTISFDYVSHKGRSLFTEVEFELKEGLFESKKKYLPSLKSIINRFKNEGLIDERINHTKYQRIISSLNLKGKEL